MKAHKHSKHANNQLMFSYAIISIITLGFILIGIAFFCMNSYANTLNTNSISFSHLRPIATAQNSSKEVVDKDGSGDFVIKSIRSYTITPDNPLILDEQKRTLVEAWNIVRKGCAGDVEKIRDMSVKEFGDIIGAKPVNELLRYIIGTNSTAFYLKEDAYMNMPSWKRFFLSWLGMNFSGIYYFKRFSKLELIIKISSKFKWIRTELSIDELRLLTRLSKPMLFHELCEMILTKKQMSMGHYLLAHASQEVIAAELEFAALIGKEEFVNTLNLRILELDYHRLYNSEMLAEWEKSQAKQNLEELRREKRNIEVSWETFKEKAEREFGAKITASSVKTASAGRGQGLEQGHKKEYNPVLNAIISHLRFYNDKKAGNITRAAERLWPELIEIYKMTSKDYFEHDVSVAWHYRVTKAADRISAQVKNRDVVKLLTVLDEKFNQKFNFENSIMFFWNSIKKEVMSRSIRDRRQLQSFFNMREDYLAHIDGKLSYDLEKKCKFSCTWPIKPTEGHVHNYHNEIHFHEKYPAVHRGIDIRTVPGATVRNPMKGEATVEYVPEYEKRGVTVHIYSQEHRLLWVFAHLDPYNLNKKLYNIQIKGEEIKLRDDSPLILDEDEFIGKVIEWKEPIGTKKKKQLRSVYRYFSRTLLGYRFTHLHVSAYQDVDRIKNIGPDLLEHLESNAINPLLLFKKLHHTTRAIVPHAGTMSNRNVWKHKNDAKKAIQNSA